MFQAPSTLFKMLVIPAGSYHQRLNSTVVKVTEHNRIKLLALTQISWHLQFLTKAVVVGWRWSNQALNRGCFFSWGLLFHHSYILQLINRYQSPQACNHPYVRCQKVLSWKQEMGERLLSHKQKLPIWSLITKPTQAPKITSLNSEFLEWKSGVTRASQPSLPSLPFSVRAVSTVALGQAGDSSWKG